MINKDAIKIYATQIIRYHDLLSWNKGKIKYK